MWMKIGCIEQEESMKISVDKESDTLYFRLDESKIVESEEVRPGIILDFDKNDRVVGIEFLNISSRATEEELSTMQCSISVTTESFQKAVWNKLNHRLSVL